MQAIGTIDNFCKWSDCPYLLYSKPTPIPSMLLRLSLPSIFQTYLQFLLCCSDCPYLQYSKHTSNSFYVAQIFLTYNILNSTPIPSVLLRLSSPSVFLTYLQFLLCCSDCPYLQYSKLNSNSFCVAQIVLTFCIPNIPPIPSMLLRLSLRTIGAT